MSKASKEKKEPENGVMPEEIIMDKYVVTEEIAEKVAAIQVEEVKQIIPTPAEITNKAYEESKLPFDERIKNFLSKRSGRGYVRMNDFLKSLYPLPMDITERPMWTKQTVCKTLKVLLDKMCANKEIEIYSDAHRRLATHYYEPTDPNQVTRYHDLTTIPIDGKIL